MANGKLGIKNAKVKGTGLNTAITSLLSIANKHSIRACTRRKVIVKNVASSSR